MGCCWWHVARFWVDWNISTTVKLFLWTKTKTGTIFVGSPAICWNILFFAVATRRRSYLCDIAIVKRNARILYHLEFWLWFDTTIQIYHFRSGNNHRSDIYRSHFRILVENHHWKFSRTVQSVNPCTKTYLLKQSSGSVSISFSILQSLNLK